MQIRFYCLQNRGSGASLMAKAAINSHARALYALAVIQFNGSGGTKSDKDLRAGVALCARAAFLGHVDALRELAAVLSTGAAARTWLSWNLQPQQLRQGSGCPLLSDFGCNVPAPDVHPASLFMTEWFAAHGGSPGPGLRLCSNAGCGRPETRKHEFRRCSVCGEVNYCSRACQALDWKFRHKAECSPVQRWLEEDGEDVGNDDGDGEVEVMVDS